MLNTIDYLSPFEIDKIYYHFPCDDGFSAYVISRFFMEKHNKKVKYVGIGRARPPPDASDVANKNVLFLDFAFNLETMSILNASAKKLLILDHHDTSRALTNLPGCHLDMNKCGSELAWAYFFPNEPLPYFLTLISDNDLHTKLYKETEAFIAMLRVEPYKYESFLKYFDREYCQEIIKKGLTIVAFNSALAEGEAKKARLKILVTPDGNGYDVLALNSSAHWMNNKIAECLCNKYPQMIIALWYMNPYDDFITVSLRTAGLYNVAAIAEKFKGGGGHVKAAGFRYGGQVNEILQNPINRKIYDKF